MIQLDQKLLHPYSTTGVAVVGCGYWGVNYVRVFSELPDSKVVAVCDKRTERLVDIARRYPSIELTEDVADVFEHPDVEAVVIAAEATRHHELVSEALHAGKHVLVEKPLTTSREDAEDLIELAESCGRHLLVGHTFLYNSGIQTIRKLVDDGSIGNTYYLYARRTSLGPIRHDVNAIWDLAPHDVTIFNYLLSATPQWVSAVGSRVLKNCRDDVGFITLGYGNGLIGHIHVSWVDPNKVREVVVVGSERRVVFNDLDPLERVRIFDKGVTLVPNEEPVSFGEFQFLLRDGDIVSPAIPPSEPLKNQCGHFLHCIRRGETPFTPAQQGRDTVAVMEAIAESVANDGAPVPISLPQPERTSPHHETSIASLAVQKEAV
jgi:predicted dehydrogenase